MSALCPFCFDLVSADIDESGLVQGGEGFRERPDLRLTPATLVTNTVDVTPPFCLPRMRPFTSRESPRHPLSGRACWINRSQLSSSPRHESDRKVFPALSFFRFKAPV